MSDQRMVKLAELWERTSARGTRYFSGFMGDTQVLMFDGGEKPHPTKPGETVHVWRLMVQERDPARRPGAKSANLAGSDAGGGPVSTSAPAKHDARPQGRGDGWRGSAYRRLANGARRAPAADGGAFYDDPLDDIGRG